MKIVVAPDSFKGSLSAQGVSDALTRGILRGCPDASIEAIPLGDGGEGTMDCLVAATGGQVHTAWVQNPFGQLIEGRYAILGDGKTAVIECAEAAGLTLIPEADRNPGLATTYGVGQLLLAATLHQVERAIVCLGGSGTQDGGAGLLQALGVALLDNQGQSLPPGGVALSRLAHIDWSGVDKRVAQIECLVACDVDTPLCGPSGTSRIFAPQKGATPAMVEALDAAMDNYAAIVEATTGRSIRDVPGGGAAGGLGAGLLMACTTRLTRGIDVVLDAVRFRDRLKDADLVITGEGRVDSQSILGKTISGVVQCAGELGIPTIAVVGSIGDGFEGLYDRGLTAAFSIVNGPMTLSEALQHSDALLVQAAQNIARLVLNTNLDTKL